VGTGQVVGASLLSLPGAMTKPAKQQEASLCSSLCAHLPA
jgi:hypothetical protein